MITGINPGCIRAIAVVSTFNRKFSVICFITGTVIFIFFGSWGANPAGSAIQCAPNSTLYSACSYLYSQPATCPVAIYLSLSWSLPLFHKIWRYAIVNGVRSFFKSSQWKTTLSWRLGTRSIENSIDSPPPPPPKPLFFYPSMAWSILIERFISHVLPTWRNSFYRIPRVSMEMKGENRWRAGAKRTDGRRGNGGAGGRARAPGEGVRV